RPCNKQYSTAFITDGAGSWTACVGGRFDDFGRRKLVARGSRYAPMPSASLNEFNIRSRFNMNPCSRLRRHADRSQRICAIVREQSNRAAFLATKYASPRLPPIPPHAWPISCPGCRDLETIGGIGRVS